MYDIGGVLSIVNDKFTAFDDSLYIVDGLTIL